MRADDPPSFAAGCRAAGDLFEPAPAPEFEPEPVAFDGLPLGDAVGREPVFSAALGRADAAGRADDAESLWDFIEVCGLAEPCTFAAAAAAAAPVVISGRLELAGALDGRFDWVGLAALDCGAADRVAGASEARLCISERLTEGAVGGDAARLAAGVRLLTAGVRLRVLEPDTTPMRVPAAAADRRCTAGACR